MTALTDAVRDSVAREIATLRRDAARERELRDAQFAARMAELETRISAVSELERKVADRLATLKDGEPGRDGRDGVDGNSGRDGVDGISGADGRPGENGRDGTNGADGRDGTAVSVDHVQEMVRAECERILSTWERPQDGRSVTLDEVAPLIAETISVAVAALPPATDGRDGADGKDGADGERGADGSSVTLDELLPHIEESVQRAVSAIPTPRDGRDAEITPEIIVEAVRGAPDAVRLAVAAYLVDNPPAPGRDGKDGADGRDGDPGREGRDGIDGKDGERGAEGPAGKLPIITEWEDRVHYEGEVVTRDGSVFQANCDTGKEPGHDDWRCIVAAGANGRDGADGRSFNIRGTWVEDGEYLSLDVVALNGASFAARRDAPGPCPGEGWQIISMQGKRGASGETGTPGQKGEPGRAATVTALRSDGEGLLTIVNADGSQVECDLYPLLSKLNG